MTVKCCGLFSASLCRFLVKGLRSLVLLARLAGGVAQVRVFASRLLTGESASTSWRFDLVNIPPLPLPLSPALVLSPADASLPRRLVAVLAGGVSAT